MYRKFFNFDESIRCHPCKVYKKNCCKSKFSKSKQKKENFTFVKCDLTSDSFEKKSKVKPKQHKNHRAMNSSKIGLNF